MILFIIARRSSIALHATSSSSRARRARGLFTTYCTWLAAQPTVSSSDPSVVASCRAHVLPPPALAFFRGFKNFSRSLCAEKYTLTSRPSTHRATLALSTGLGALVSAHKVVAARGGRVRLVHVQPAVRQLLELLKFQELFEINA